jgi:DNA invertase Pin-like site-specific DNA recombinase
MDVFNLAPPIKAYSYVRVSGRGQLDGDGPDRQREKIVQFCSANNLEIVREYFERAVSGTIEAVDRPQFAALIEAMDTQGGVAAIVVERMDRLARDLMVSEVLLSECRKRGIKVYAADQGMLIDMAAEGADPTRVLIRQILGALAQWEKSMLVAKLRAARDRKRRLEGRCEGPKRYGSKPGEKEIVNLIHNFRTVLDEADQPMEWAEVARRLNESGFRTRFGKPWSRFTTADIFERTQPTKMLELDDSYSIPLY